MKRKKSFEKEIMDINSRCTDMAGFIEAFKDFISPRISNYFFELNDWESDLNYLYDFAEENELPQSDWILLVADYSCKALDEDIGSIQARDSLETYMKLHTN